MIQIYQHFIRQVRQQQIRAYNQRHKVYVDKIAKQRPVNVQNKRQRKRDYTFERASIPRGNQQLNNQHQIADKIRQPLLQKTPATKRYVQADTQIQQNAVRIQPEERKINTKVPTFNEFQEQQVQKIDLIQCPQGCGRKFKPQLIQKHSKVCKKVFQQKAKPKIMKPIDEQAENAKQKAQKASKNQKQKKDKKYDWKIESEKFRNAMKANKGQETQVEIADDRVQCPGCGRKFNDKAAQKHISFCTKRVKK